MWTSCGVINNLTDVKPQTNSFQCQKYNSNQVSVIMDLLNALKQRTHTETKYKVQRLVGSKDRVETNR